MLTKDELKELRQIRALVEAANPGGDRVLLRGGIEFEYEERHKRTPVATPEEWDLVFAPSKQFQDHWRKADSKPAPDLVRRQYACFALMGMLASSPSRDAINYDGVAAESFLIADAMIAAEDAE